MKVVKTLLKAAAALALTVTVHAGAQGWATNFEVARAQASKEGKDLLIDFTGSDWCGWCVKLKKEVFVHDAFKKGVMDNFVLLEIDFPRDRSKIEEATLTQNKVLGKKYAVRGYPTILLTDAEGRPYAKTGYRAGGPESYVKHLDELRAIKSRRDESLAAAAKLEGVAMAKAMVAALRQMELDEAQVEAFYAKEVEQIKAADPQDASGYIKGMELKKQLTKFHKDFSALARKKDMEGALKLVDDTIAKLDLEGAQTQRMLMTKAMILSNIGREDDALAQIEKALAANPQGEHSEAIGRVREKIQQTKAKKQAEAEAKAVGQSKELKDKTAETGDKSAEASEEPIRARDK